MMQCGLKKRLVFSHNLAIHHITSASRSFFASGSEFSDAVPDHVEEQVSEQPGDSNRQHQHVRAGDYFQRDAHGCFHFLALPFPPAYTWSPASDPPRLKA